MNIDFSDSQHNGLPIVPVFFSLYNRAVQKASRTSGFRKKSETKEETSWEKFP
jgi:hypothetical protein